MLYDCVGSVDPANITYPDSITYTITDNSTSTVVSANFSPNDDKETALTYFSSYWEPGYDHKYTWVKNTSF